MTNSNAKGKAAEREAARELSRLFPGWTLRRSQQFCGVAGDADLVGLPGVHIEVKRRERLNIHNAIQQATDDARARDTPIVVHRANNKPWLVTCQLDDLRTLAIKLYLAMAGEEDPAP